MSEVRKIDISSATFLKIIIIFVVFVFLYLVKGILALIFLALILSSAIDPWVEWLKDRGVPKTLSIITIYVLFVAIILTTVLLVIPPMTREIGQLAHLFPAYYSKLTSIFNRFQGVKDPGFVQNVQMGLNTVSSNLSSTINGLFTTTAQVFGGLFSFITILILAFYFAMEEDAMKKFANSIIPEKYQSYATDLAPRIQKKLGQWFRGQLTLSLIIFVIIFVALLIARVKYALILALLAGSFEIIPYFGPWISGTVAVLLTFTQSPMQALIVAIIYLVVQQLENSFIVPKVIGKSVGLNPIVVLIGILVGFKLVGVVGGLIAVPIIAAISVFVTDVINKKDFKQI